MAHWNNIVRGNIMAIRTQKGHDPTAIVGEGNLVASESNPNAWSGIPGTAPDTGSEFKAPAPEAGPIPSAGKASGGDPYAGMDASKW